MPPFGQDNEFNGTYGRRRPRLDGTEPPVTTTPLAPTAPRSNPSGPYNPDPVDPPASPAAPWNPTRLARLGVGMFTGAPAGVDYLATSRSYDPAKLADPNHKSAKYQIARVQQQHDYSKGITPEYLAALNALGIGTFESAGGGGGKVRVRGASAWGTGNDFILDQIADLSSGDPSRMGWRSGFGQLFRQGHHANATSDPTLNAWLESTTAPPMVSPNFPMTVEMFQQALASLPPLQPAQGPTYNITAPAEDYGPASAPAPVMSGVSQPWVQDSDGVAQALRLMAMQVPQMLRQASPTDPLMERILALVNGR